MRVPWEMFVRDAKAARLGQNPNPKKASGRKSLPVQLKILGCLHVMAIGCPWDELSYELPLDVAATPSVPCTVHIEPRG